jgi:hypothetical protein
VVHDRACVRVSGGHRLRRGLSSWAASPIPDRQGKDLAVTGDEEHLIALLTATMMTVEGRDGITD